MPSTHTKYSPVNYFFIQPYLILTYFCSNQILNTLFSARYAFKIFSLNASKCFGLQKEAPSLKDALHQSKHKLQVVKKMVSRFFWKLPQTFLFFCQNPVFHKTSEYQIFWAALIKSTTFSSRICLCLPLERVHQDETSTVIPFCQQKKFKRMLCSSDHSGT